MIKTLIIAEKPDLAKVIASALPGSPRKLKGYIEVGDTVVTYCIGHLLEQKMPEEIDPALTFSWENLPYPTGFELKVKDNTADQFKVVESLIKQAETLVNAGDPDEEGQLLVDEVIEYCGISPDAPNIKRLLLSDMNTGAARKALADLQQNSDQRFRGLRNRALSRSRADYKFGIDLSSAIILKAREQNYQGVPSVGRVQTAVLGLVVQRYRDNQNFDSVFFWQVKVIATVKGVACTFVITPPDDAPLDDKGRINSEDYADELITRLSGQTMTLTGADHKAGKKSPPRPFSLLRLQVRVGKRYGISPDETLEITQALREKHKCITYNRSDCQYCSDEQWEAAAETLDGLRSWIGSTFGLENASTALKSDAFNDEKISAHTAIIPVPARIGQLTEREQQVFLEIVRYWLAQFYPKQETLTHRLTAEIDGLTASFSSTETTAPGWKALFSDASDDDDEEEELSGISALRDVVAGDALTVTEIIHTKGKTSPPKLFTSVSLMEELPRVSRYIRNPQLRERMQLRDKERSEDGRGIGTPATRSSIIRDLEEKRHFWETNSKKQLIPTEAGLQLIDSLPPLFTTPDLTATWEEWLTAIEEGRCEPDKFINDIVLPLVARETGNIRTGKTPLLLKGSAYTCPVCKTRPLRRLKSKEKDGFYWMCAGGLEDGQPCKTFFDDRDGKPVARKKKSHKK
ncbi:DNA topoisomerase [Klebsiella oxytoca]|uniref:DNA topoisomerase n=1 Tax=Klebsiella oxytoca TaxID=571 RepID=UPI00254AD264|nr:DNA topoisomerase [Klebsiella oxytoca]MEC5509924.1 DNA topoisomerase [Klebsiella oxytoca]